MAAVSLGLFARGIHLAFQPTDVADGDGKKYDMETDDERELNTRQQHGGRGP